MGILDGQAASIRAALSTTLTVAALPDATIALPLYQGAAEREAAARVAGLTLDTDQQAQLVEAAIYLCAARLALAVPSITQEGVGRRDYEYRAQPLAPDALAKQLRARASAAISSIKGESGRPAVFARAPGGRAQSADPLVAIPLGTSITVAGG